MPYAIIDPDGNLRDLVPDVDAAVQSAAQYSPFVQVENGPQVHSGLGDAGLGALNLRQAEHALKMCGVKPMALPTDSIMSLGEAHRRLLPFFPTQRFVKARGGVEVNTWEPVLAYDTPQKMSERILGQNYKTAKTDLGIEVSTSVMGLSLLPAQSLAGKPGFERFAKVNACVGASAACIASCLVYSGHNTMDPYNAIVKAARYKALVHEPVAFMRMLSENIARHGRSRKAEPYIRLNVFSDLPWELICPDLFAAHSDIRFYDYTKVVNRDLSRTPNYDLTYSFSGSNKAQVAHELNRGLRVAVVFIPPYRIPNEGRERGAGLPDQLDTDEVFGTNFGEPLEVLDGDVSDVRPREPGRVIVGLRWKIPMGRQAEAFAQAQEAAFAVPVEDMGNGVLIAATSARNEPISDFDADEFEEAA